MGWKGRTVWLAGRSGRPRAFSCEALVANVAREAPGARRIHRVADPENDLTVPSRQDERMSDDGLTRDLGSASQHQTPLGRARTTSDALVDSQTECETTLADARTPTDIGRCAVETPATMSVPGRWDH